MGIGGQKIITRSREGFTLVELMVAMALSGLLALGLASLMTVSARQALEGQKVADFEEEIDLFEYKMRTLFMGMSQVISCACSADVGGCKWTDSVAAPGTLLTADFETDTDLFDGTVAPCPATVGRLGCKQMISLVYTAATPQTVVSAGQSRIGSAGFLSMQTALGQELARLNGVTQVACGFLGSTPEGVAVQSFRLFINAKARTTSASKGAAAELQGWHPTDPGFSNGILRWLPFQLEATNLSQRGLLVLSTSTTVGCSQDGLVGPAGSCCSGYQMMSGGACMRASECILSGGAIGLGVGLSGIATECCTHQDVRGGSCARTSTLVQ